MLLRFWELEAEKRKMKKSIKLFVMAVLLIAGGRVFAQDTHEYVDLGLPSGTLWATCNVGATTPEGKGDHFTWGDTNPEIYDGVKRPIKYWDNQSGFIKYRREEGLFVLLPEDDAATVNWGPEWRTPTMEDWKELKENTRVENFTMNGVWGFRYIGPNGNSIFLPGAGWNQYFDGRGNYWSSTLLLNSNAEAYCFWYTGFSNVRRDNGCSVRPVRVTK